MARSPHECVVCGYGFDVHLADVDAREAPYFTHEAEVSDGTATRWICSSYCMHKYLQTVEYTDPRGTGE